MLKLNLIILILYLFFHSTSAQAQPFSNAHFNQLAQKCTKEIHHDTLQAIARVESGFNPYAIGVVKGNLKRQPKTFQEAQQAVQMLLNQGKNFSMGLMQINKHNLKHYGLNFETVFNPCRNIQVGARILKECFIRAGGKGQLALQKAFSCYYSGNFTTGFKSDFKGQPPYVTKILQASLKNNNKQQIKITNQQKNTVTVGTTEKFETPQPIKKSESWDIFSELDNTTF